MLDYDLNDTEDLLVSKDTASLIARLGILFRDGGQNSQLVPQITEILTSRMEYDGNEIMQGYVLIKDRRDECTKREDYEVAGRYQELLEIFENKIMG